MPPPGKGSGQPHQGGKTKQPRQDEAPKRPRREEESQQSLGGEESEQPRQQEMPKPEETLELADPKRQRHESFFDDRPKRVVWDEVKEQTKACYRIETFMSNVPVDQSLHDTDAYKQQRIKAAYIDALNLKETSGEPEVLPTPITLDHFLVDPAYKPPIGKSGRMERVKHVDDLSQIAPEKVPVRVFCDIGKHSTDHIFSYSFTYSKENFYRDQINQDPLAKLILKCDCHGQCKPETCKCMQAQRKAFPDVKHIGYGLVVDNFDYYGAGKKLNNYENALIVCGELCGCNPKKCTNHITYFKSIPQTIEVFRRNEKRGFTIRTLNNIRFDQLVCEVTGTVIKAGAVEIDPRRQTSVVELAGEDAMHILEKLCEISGRTMVEFDYWQYREIKDAQEEQKEDLVEWFAKDPARHYDRVVKEGGYFIDTYRMSNVSRFASHGCCPNVIPVRLIANYLHPKYHRIFLKALHHIPAGSEIFVNYGADYLERAGFECQCGNMLCKAKTPLEKQFVANMNHEKLLAALLQIRLNLVKVMHTNEDEARKREPDGSFRSGFTLDRDGEEEVPEKVARVNPLEIYKENPEIAEYNKFNNRRYIGQSEETERQERIAEREYNLRRAAEIIENAERAERFHNRERRVDRVQFEYYHRDPTEILREQGLLDGEDPQRAEMEALGYHWPP